MHSAGCYLDFRILFSPRSNKKFHIRFTTRIRLEKKFGAIVSWVLKDRIDFFQALHGVIFVVDGNEDVLFVGRGEGIRVSIFENISPRPAHVQYSAYFFAVSKILEEIITYTT